METFRDELESLDIQINNTRKDVWDFLDKVKMLEKRIETLEMEKKKRNELIKKLKRKFINFFSKLKLKIKQK